MKFTTRLLAVLAVSLFQSLSVQASMIVERINEDDIVNSQTLDFLSQPLGDFSGTANLFQNYGIENVTASASSPNGEEYARGDYDKALWVGSNGGVTVVGNNDAAGCSQYDADFKCIGDRLLPLVEFYNFEFAQDMNQVGFYMVDVWLPLVFSFYADGNLVEIYDEQERGSWDGNTLGTGTGWTAWRAFESSVAFDEIRIESRNSVADGFGVALIRTTSIPEPASVFLFLSAAFGLSLRLKRTR